MRTDGSGQNTFNIRVYGEKIGEKLETVIGSAKELVSYELMMFTKAKAGVGSQSGMLLDVLKIVKVGWFYDDGS